MGRLFEGKARLASVVLHRVGVEATISKPDGTASTNKYGKTEDGDRNYTDIATETVHRIFTSDSDRSDEARVAGGRIDVENPRLAFQQNTAAEEDYRVTFSDTDRTYVLDELIPMKTHTEFRATLLNE